VGPSPQLQPGRDGEDHHSGKIDEVEKRRRRRAETGGQYRPKGWTIEADVGRRQPGGVERQEGDAGAEIAEDEPLHAAASAIGRRSR
jgi:hypothetical protein